MPDRLSDVGRSHAIATPHAAASAAGDAIFRRGGTAFDAALAAAAALTVCYPHMCAVGGDIIALAATPDGAVRVVNGSGAAPAGASAAELDAEFGLMPLRGAHSVTVPGAVAAWETLREIGGTLRFADLLEPAAKMAEEGVAVAPSLAKSLVDEERRRRSRGRRGHERGVPAERPGAGSGRRARPAGAGADAAGAAGERARRALPRPGRRGDHGPAERPRVANGDGRSGLPRDRGVRAARPRASATRRC